MIVVHRRYRFPAAHVLASPELSDEENGRIFGKCANPNGHGHDYGVEVGVTGEVDPETGHVIPPETLDAIFDQRIRQPFSHRLLNDLPEFARRVPTAEVIAIVIHDALAPAIAEGSDARLLQVRVVETRRNSFQYGESP